MALDTRISGLPPNPGVAASDLVEVVDVSNTTNQATGENTKVTVAQLAAGLPVMGASGTGHAAGLVPDPGATGGTARFLREDATFAVPAGGSGGTSPGGASGNVQYNNAGAFGGLASVPVASGGTGLTAMGTALQVLRVNAGATALEYAAASGGGTPGGSPGQIQYNNAGAFGGLAVPVSVAQGGTGLGALGTALQVLRVNSGATALEYAAASGAVDPILWSTTSVGAYVANTATPTSLFNSQTLRGSLTIPANRLVAGCRLALKMYGGVAATGTPTLGFTVKIGGQTLFTGVTGALSGTATVVKHWYLANDSIFVPVVGAIGKIAGSGQFVVVNTATSSMAAATMTQAGDGGESAPIMVDTTGPLVVDILVTWGTADPANKIRLDYASMEIVGG